MRKKVEKVPAREKRKKELWRNLELHTSANFSWIISSDRSSYCDGGLLYVRRQSHFLRFQAFLPIYLVFLFANLLNSD